MDGTSHFSQIIDLFCQYFEAAKESQFFQQIVSNAGQRHFLIFCKKTQSVTGRWNLHFLHFNVF
jgi:hypothetical protein